MVNVSEDDDEEVEFQVGDQVSVLRSSNHHNQNQRRGSGGSGGSGGSTRKHRETGTVASLNPDRTYAVDYYSSDKDTGVAGANMRLYNPCKVRNQVPAASCMHQLSTSVLLQDLAHLFQRGDLPLHAYVRSNESTNEFRQAFDAQHKIVHRHR